MPKESLDRVGRSELHYAVCDGKVGEASTLIRGGADVNRQDKNGWTPLHFAAQLQTTQMADPALAACMTELLLKAGAVVDTKDSHGNTPLSNAVFDYRGEGSTIKLLREWGPIRSQRTTMG